MSREGTRWTKAACPHGFTRRREAREEGSGSPILFALPASWRETARPGDRLGRFGAPDDDPDQPGVPRSRRPPRPPWRLHHGPTLQPAREHPSHADASSGARGTEGLALARGPGTEEAPSVSPAVETAVCAVWRRRTPICRGIGSAKEVHATRGRDRRTRRAGSTGGHLDRAPFSVDQWRQPCATTVP